MLLVLELPTQRHSLLYEPHHLQARFSSHQTANMTSRGSISSSGLSSIDDNEAENFAAPSVRAAPRAAPLAFVIPTPAQRAIRRILSLNTKSDLGNAAKALAQLDARPLPSVLTADQLVPSLNPRACCFDAATGTRPSWTCHSPCTRCRVLGQLIKGEYLAVRCHRLP